MLTLELVESRLLGIEEKLSFLASILATDKKDQDIIDIAEAAKLVNQTVGTIYTKTSRRTIPHIKKGKLVLFSRKKLIEWLEEGNVKTVSEEIADAEKFRVNKMQGKN